MLKRATRRRDLSERRDRALAHEAAGRMRDAISEWTAINHIEADPWIESHLVDLRCDPGTIAADYEADGNGGIPGEQWPRVLPDPFPEITDRPPEIRADQLSM